jgi:hypothetical protein
LKRIVASGSEPFDELLPATFAGAALPVDFVDEGFAVVDFDCASRP